MTINPNYNIDSLDVNKDVDEEGTTTVHLYNAAHGKTPRTGGPYLDDVERELAEERRAKVEGREPDLENPPASAGTVLVPKSALTETDADKNHLSGTVEVTNEPVSSYIVPVEVNEPDPTQANWDNDGSKIAALEAAQRLEALSKGQISPNLPSDQTNAAVAATEVTEEPVVEDSDFTPVDVETDTDTQKTGSDV